MSRRGLRLVLALLITAAALWLSFRNVDWEAMRAAFRGLRPLWLAPAVASSLAGVWLMGLRWGALLRPKAHLGQWAQVRYKYASTFEDAQVKLEYDLYYISRWSLSLDILILARTLGVVLRGDVRQ